MKLQTPPNACGAGARFARFTALLALSSLLALLAAAPARAQTEFWREEFDNGCTALCPADGYVGTGGVWTVTDVSPPGTVANVWYVSCAENGGAEGTCGSSCRGDASLHVGNVAASPAAFQFCPTGDCGAAYDDSDPTVWTDKRIESPPIDASGKSGLSVTFLYLAGGVACSDATDLVWSGDGGLSWSVLAACLPDGGFTCFPQGRWQRRTVDLPPAADNSPSLRLGFHWRNDGDGFGFDPSIAVDELVLRHTDCSTAPPPLPVDLANHLRGVKSGSDAAFDWSAMGVPLATTTHFHVYRALSPRLPVPSGWVLQAGDAPLLTAQAWTDPAVIGDGTTYYYDVRSAGDCEAISPR